jgi:filamentous hemagglutinin family protein
MPAPLTTPHATRRPAGRMAGPAPRLHAVAVALAAMGLAGAVHAQVVLPTNGVVVRGAATITQGGADMNITQTSNRAAIEWGSFSVGAGGAVRHEVPNASSITLHRVVGAGGTSLIDGVISSNGRVFLVNTSGVVFGSTAQINVGSLVASSRDLDPALIANNYVGFENASQLSFTQGTDLSDGTFGDKITVDSGAQLASGPNGSIVLIGGRQVAVSGTLATASGGNVALVAAPSTTVNLTESGFVQLVATAGGGASNVSSSRSISIASGSVSAPDGMVQIQARGNAIDDTSVSLSEAVVTVRGETAGDRRIEIIATGNTDARISMTGVDIDASSDAANSTGGTVAIAAPRISINQRSLPSGVAAAAAVPGFDNAIQADGKAGGGSIEIGEAESLAALDLGATLSILVDASSLVSASATEQGSGGRISLVSTRNVASEAPSAGESFGLVAVHGSLSARGAGTGNGGNILTQGPSLLFSGDGLATAAVDAAAGSDAGTAGTWRIQAFDAVVSTQGQNPGSTPIALLGQGEINGALDSGTSVTLVAQSPVNNATSNVQVLEGVALGRKAGTAPVTLSLQAQNNVVLGANSSIIAESGPLNVELVANLNGGGAGGVDLFGSLGTSSGPLPVTITTLGGNVVIGGTSNPAIGLAERRGEAGVNISGSVIDTRNAAGTDAGNISIRGRGGLFEGEGVQGAEGVSITGSTFTGNNISVLGAGSAGNGVRVDSTGFTTATGAIDLRGVLDDQVGSSSAAGVLLGAGTSVDLGSNGTLTVAGRANAEGGEAVVAGVRIDSVQVSGGSRVTLAGESDAAGGFGILQDTGAGLRITANADGGTSTADVILGGLAPGSGDGSQALAINQLQIHTSGRVNFRPLSVTAGTDEGGTPVIDITESTSSRIAVGATTTNDVDFLVRGEWLGALTGDSVVEAAGIVIGSAQHAGQIRVGNGAMADSAAGTSISLQNQGGESQGIVFEGAAGGAGLSQLSLLTAGNVTQAGGLKAGQLVIQGGPGSSIELESPDNRIGGISFDPPFSLLLSTSGNLVVNSGTAQGFDTSGEAPGFTATQITRNEGGQTLRLRSLDGNLVLDNSIAMNGDNATVDLVAGNTFQNTNGATITFGEGGGQWRIWSATLQGFQSGGLEASRPNFFDCAFGNCEAPGGNGFLFAQAAPDSVPFTPPVLFQEFLADAFLSDQRSEVYGLNTPNRPQICAAVSSIRGIDQPEIKLDPLTVEWTRVRGQPHLSSCLDVRNDNACSSF